MIVFETAKRGMDNGISDTEYVLPEVVILGSLRKPMGSLQCWGNRRGLVGRKYQII